MGTHEIVEQVHQLAEGFRALGHFSTTVVLDRNPLYPTARYDVVLNSRLPAGAGMARRMGAALRRVRQLPRLIRGHDAFVFVFGDTLLPRNLDVPILWLLRKDLVFIFLGSDVRHWEATEQHRAKVGLAYYDGYRERPAPAAVRRLRIAELFGSVTYMQPSYAEAAIAPYMHAPLAMDVGRYQARMPDNEIPIVVHAPSRRALKGTAEILEALERLREGGVAFELRLLENVPNDQVLEMLAEADVVADEVREAHYGMLALEGMASACAVLAGNRPDIVPVPWPRPIIHLSPENLAEELRKVLTDRDHRLAVASQGPTFVAAHHERSSVAKRILEDLGRAARGDFDYQPTFFAVEYEPHAVSAGPAERALTWLVCRRRRLAASLRRSMRARHLSW